MKRKVRSKSVGTKVTEAELRVLESRAERAAVTRRSGGPPVWRALLLQ